jgi:molecular chaperone DnaK
MGVAVGIDLGTTNTVVAVVKDGVATTLTDSEGSKLIPSVVAFHPNGTVQVGTSALERRIIDPENTVYSVKRLIGRSFDSNEVKQHRARYPFDLVEGPKGATLVATRAETYALPEISAFVLRRAKAIAEGALGETVDSAVITVPANFDDPQRASTKMAGKLAGLEVLRILNEPTAAALAYGRSPEKSERICVYDLGGGTFDVTILDVASGVFEVLATAGDTALGGDDVDSLIVERMVAEAIQKLRVDPRGNPPAMARLRVAAEKLKKILSTKTDSGVEASDVGRAEEGIPLTLKFSMTRAELERIAQPLIDRTLAVTRAATEVTSLKVSDVDRVILVGGATRMPTVVKQVEAHFKRRADQRINPDEVVALGAAIQAHALSARKVRSERRALPPSTPRPQAPAVPPVASMPPEVAHAVTATRPGVGAPRSLEASAHTHPTRPALRQQKAPPPKRLQEIRSKRPDPRVEPESEPPQEAPVFVGKPGPQLPATVPATRAVRVPEEASRPVHWSSVPPVLGAEQVPDLELPKPLPALPGTAKAPAAPLPETARPPPAAKPPKVEELPSSELKPAALAAHESLLIDVTPLSLRVETAGGFSDILIAANSRVPCDRTRVFSTASDRQTQVFIRVAQGEKSQFTENTFLGELELSGLVPLPRGEAKIAVTFEIDADGILAVRAKDDRTGKETAAKMHVFGAQTDEGDFKQMMHRQEAHAVS